MELHLNKLTEDLFEQYTREADSEVITKLLNELFKEYQKAKGIPNEEKPKTFVYTFFGEVGIVTVFAEDEEIAWAILADNVIRVDEYELHDVEEMEE